MARKSKDQRLAEESLAQVQAAMRVGNAMHKALDPMVEAGVCLVGRTWSLPVQSEIARDQLLHIDQYVMEMVQDLEEHIPGISEVASDMGGNLLLDGDGLLEAWFDGQ